MFLRKRAVRLLALALALVATSLAVKDVRIAEAVNTTTQCYYFSDSTHAVVVGSYTRLCNGQVNTTGTMTPYKICVSQACP
jgi:hypothetical protein